MIAMLNLCFLPFKYEEIETSQYEEYITEDQYEEVEEQVIGMQQLEEEGTEVGMDPLCTVYTAPGLHNIRWL